MNNHLGTELASFLAGRKIIEGCDLRLDIPDHTNRLLQLKVYVVGNNGLYDPKKDYLIEAVSAGACVIEALKTGKIEPHTYYGTVVASMPPPFASSEYESMCLLSLWKETSSEEPKNVRDNTLIMKRKDGKFEVLINRGDLTCTTEDAIHYLDGKIWEQVIAGKITPNEYLGIFPLDPFIQTQ